MLQIYHAQHTRGIRPIWLCEELDLPYQVVPVDFSAEYRASPEWRALHPAGKVPVLVDDDVTMFESCAMMDYILARYGDGRLVPTAADENFASYLQWHWFAESTLARPLGEVINHGREFPDQNRIEPVVEEMINRSLLSLNAVAQTVQNQTYIAGDEFTAADISMGYSLHLARMILGERWPNELDAYWQKLADRPGYQVAASAL